MKDVPYNPYVAAKAEFLECYGGYVKSAAQWRIVAVVALVLAVAAIVCNVIQARQFKVVPYLVQVDSLGKAAVLGRAEAASPTPPALIQASLAEMIVSWRTVTADLDLQKRMVNRLASYVAGSAQGQITEWFERNNPYKTAQDGRLIQVAVKGLPLPVSADSWRVEWTETIRSHSGQFISAVTYEATLNVKIQPPTTDAQIMANPGGVYVVGLSYSKVLAGQPVPEAPAPGTPAAGPQTEPAKNNEVNQ